ncbi:MAG: FAD-binding protein [Spirochaetaceae bacterium]|nr:MAG: FAD-binding protein [Spirochaetaceae bacterium]
MEVRVTLDGQHYDVVVIGGGVAGLAAAQYAALAELRTVVLEGTGIGGQCLHIGALENYPGVDPPPNGLDFAQTLQSQAERFGARVVASQALRIDKDEAFRVETTDGRIDSLIVILATGATHRTLGVPGEAELAGRGVSYCATCDGPFFRDRPVIVVGGGDSACDEALFLAGLTDRVTIIHRGPKLSAQRGLASRVLAHPAIDVRFNATVRRIDGAASRYGFDTVSGVVVDVGGSVQTIAANAVFVFIGSTPRTDLVPTLPKDHDGRVITDEHMETTVRGLFAVGEVRRTPWRQLVVAAAEGAIAANRSAWRIETDQLGFADNRSTGILSPCDCS